MNESIASAAETLDEFGWVLLGGAIEIAEIRNLARSLDAAFAEPGESTESVRHREGAVYAARNVLDLCPLAASCWRRPMLIDLLSHVLGPECGLVRGLYFDKPPDQTWALPWHKDLTIAVADGSSGEGYSRPRLRAGVYHCEPPTAVLESMLTVRIHLDDATAANGALSVISGSHRSGKVLATQGLSARLIAASAGDVLAMRPLLVHGSGRSEPGSQDHRRVLHLEFAAREQLPGGVRWRRFIR